MGRRSIWILTACLLIAKSIAQNSSDSACAKIEDVIRYNTSTTREIPAIFVNGNRPDPNNETSNFKDTFRIEQDSSQNWTLIYRIQHESGFNVSGAQGSLYLDTGSSNTTNMGSCHTTQAASQKIDNTEHYLWTKETLLRGLKDTGDCKLMLGEKCVNALKAKYTSEAAQNHMRRGSCEKTNNTIPRECSSLLVPVTSEMNLTSPLFGNTTFDKNIRCESLNLSTTRGPLDGGFPEPKPFTMSYESAVRFPLVDIITFWPNRSNGMQSYSTVWKEDVRVEIACLRPDTGLAGSELPVDGDRILDRQGLVFPTEGAAANLKVFGSGGMLLWMSAIAMGVMLLL